MSRPPSPPAQGGRYRGGSGYHETYDRNDGDDGDEYVSYGDPGRGGHARHTTRLNKQFDELAISSDVQGNYEHQPQHHGPEDTYYDYSHTNDSRGEPHYYDYGPKGDGNPQRHKSSKRTSDKPSSSRKYKHTASSSRRDGQEQQPFYEVVDSAPGHYQYGGYGPDYGDTPADEFSPEYYEPETTYYGDGSQPPANGYTSAEDGRKPSKGKSHSSRTKGQEKSTSSKDVGYYKHNAKGLGGGKVRQSKEKEREEEASFGGVPSQNQHYEPSDEYYQYEDGRYPQSRDDQNGALAYPQDSYYPPEAGQDYLPQTYDRTGAQRLSKSRNTERRKEKELGRPKAPPKQYAGGDDGYRHRGISDLADDWVDIRDQVAHNARGQEEHYEQQAQARQQNLVAADDPLPTSDVNLFDKQNNMVRTAYLRLTIQPTWVEVTSLLDSGNTSCHLISIRMVIEMGYSVKDIDVGKVYHFKTLGGKTQTWGAVKMYYRLVEDKEKQAIEFQAFDDIADPYPYDVVFMGGSNSNSTSTPHVLMTVRPKKVKPDKAEQMMMRAQLEAQEKAIQQNKDRRKARDKAKQKAQREIADSSTAGSSRP